jgi:hypothetical protein
VTRAPRYDWAAMVFRLNGSLSVREIASRCDIEHHSRIVDLKNIPGTQPRFHDGAMLLALWADIFPDAPPPTA